MLFHYRHRRVIGLFELYPFHRGATNESFITTLLERMPDISHEFRYRCGIISRAFVEKLDRIIGFMEMSIFPEREC